MEGNKVICKCVHYTQKDKYNMQHNQCTTTTHPNCLILNNRKGNHQNESVCITQKDIHVYSGYICGFRLFFFKKRKYFSLSSVCSWVFPLVCLCVFPVFLVPITKVQKIWQNYWIFERNFLPLLEKKPCQTLKVSESEL